jgi:hypothetical protein
MERYIYTLVRRTDWAVAEEAGAYSGSEDDRRDGFLHFSTAGQLRATAAKHRAGEADLVIVGHPAEADRRALVALAGTLQGRVLDVSGELSRALNEHERRSLAPVDVLRAHGAAGARAT